MGVWAEGRYGFGRGRGTSLGARALDDADGGDEARAASVQDGVDGVGGIGLRIARLAKGRVV